MKKSRTRAPSKPSHLAISSAQHPDQPQLDKLWAGSWVSPDYLTWIGEEEENRAWDYLGEVRSYAQPKLNRVDDETRAAMLDALYTAEGSDWFWWYGSDQNSGDDASFDEQFRRTLMRVYEVNGDPIPTFLKVPVIPQSAQPPAASPTDLLEPDIDGIGGEDEWAAAGYYLEEGGVQANPNQIISQLWYGFDKDNLFLRLDARRPWADVGEDTRIGFYLTKPGGGGEQPFSRVSVLNGNEQTLLGFNANALVEVAIQGDEATAQYYPVGPDGEYAATEDVIPVGMAGSTVEVAVPYDDIWQTGGWRHLQATDCNQRR